MMGSAEGVPAMKIELRRINHNPKLSEETEAFTAEVWIDGECAFEARNQGQGGCDLYRQVGRWTEAEVNAWLKANRPIRPFEGLTLQHDLEAEVGDLLAHDNKRQAKAFGNRGDDRRRGAPFGAAEIGMNGNPPIARMSKLIQQCSRRLCGGGGILAAR